jgi:hypothetical protein
MAKRRPPSRISSGAVLCICLAVAFAIYAPALRAELVSDDNLAITGNELVTGPFAPLEIFTTFSWFGTTRADAPGYRPLVTLSFAIDRAISGLAASWLHIVNIVLHALVSWLVFELGLRIGFDRRAALVAALVFSVLPIHSEAVIWPVGRAELMAAAGFSASLLFMLQYRTEGRSVALALAAAAFLAGLFSKENAVTLLAAPPLAAWLLPGPPQARRRDAITTGVLLATLACYLGVRALAGPVIGSAAGDRLDNPLTALAIGPRLLAATSVLGRYLKLTVWPHPAFGRLLVRCARHRPGVSRRRLRRVRSCRVHGNRGVGLAPAKGTPRRDLRDRVGGSELLDRLERRSRDRHRDGRALVLLAEPGPLPGGRPSLGVGHQSSPRARGLRVGRRRHRLRVCRFRARAPMEHAGIAFRKSCRRPIPAAHVLRWSSAPRMATSGASTMR